MTEGITGDTGELTLTEIADGIRTQLNEQISYLPSEVSDAVAAVKINDSILDTKIITQPGIHRASNDGADGYASVEVQMNLGTKNIGANGVYSASNDDLSGYSSVNVDVANTYVAADEGKVVNSGALIAQTSLNISENGTYNTTLNNEVVVEVIEDPPPVERFYLLNPTLLDTLVNQTTSDGYLKPVVFPVFECCDNYSGMYTEFGVKKTMNEGSVGVIYCQNQRNETWINLTPIPGGVYSTLYIQIKVTSNTSTWAGTDVVLLDSIGIQDRTNFSATVLKRISLAAYNKDAATINGQQGVVINSTDGHGLSEQVVEIDVSDITETFYFGLWHCFSESFIRSIYLEE